MALFVGRLSTSIRTKDLEDFFSRYGKLKRCDLKGRFAFVTFEDERDAEDAVKESHGKELDGSRINVEWSRESGRRAENPNATSSRGGGGERDTRRPRRDNGCFNCGKLGHIARDCRSSPRRRDGGGGRRDSYRRSRSPRDRRSSRDRSRDRSRERSPKRKEERSPKERGSRSPRRSPRDRSRDRSPKRKEDRSPKERSSRSPRRSPDKSPKDRKSPSPKRDNGLESPQKD